MILLTNYVKIEVTGQIASYVKLEVTRKCGRD
jgi:hypothetical protein